MAAGMQPDTKNKNSNDNKGMKKTKKNVTGDLSNPAALSPEDALELTIHKLMQRIEHLEEDKANQSQRIDTMKKSMERMEHENVSKAIRMEAIGGESMNDSNSNNDNNDDEYNHTDDGNSSSGGGGRIKNDILNQLRLTSATYTQSMQAIRSAMEKRPQETSVRKLETQDETVQAAALSC